MVIENRDLAAGTKLVARYRGQEHTVLVVGDAKTGLGFELDSGTIYKSLSSAGKAVMNGVACNGWRFWSRAGEEAPAPATKAKPTPKTVRQISKLPNQKGIPQTGDEIVVRHYCAARTAGPLRQSSRFHDVGEQENSGSHRLEPRAVGGISGS